MDSCFETSHGEGTLHHRPGLGRLVDAALRGGREGVRGGARGPGRAGEGLTPLGRRRPQDAHRELVTAERVVALDALQKFSETADVVRERARGGRQVCLPRPAGVQGPQGGVEGAEEGLGAPGALLQHDVERLAPPARARRVGASSAAVGGGVVRRGAGAQQRPREGAPQLAAAGLDGDDDGPLEAQCAAAEALPELEDARRPSLERCREAVLEAGPEADVVDLELADDLAQTPEAPGEALRLLAHAPDPRAPPRLVRDHLGLALAERADHKGLEAPLRHPVRVGHQEAPHPGHVQRPVQQVHDRDAARAQDAAAAAVAAAPLALRHRPQPRPVDAAAPQGLPQRALPPVHVQDQDPALGVVGQRAPQHLRHDVHRGAEAPRDDRQRVALRHEVDDGLEVARHAAHASRSRRRRLHGAVKCSLCSPCSLEWPRSSNVEPCPVQTSVWQDCGKQSQAHKSAITDSRRGPGVHRRRRRLPTDARSMIVFNSLRIA